MIFLLTIKHLININKILLVFSQRVNTVPLINLLKRVDDLANGLSDAIDDTTEETKELNVS